MRKFFLILLLFSTISGFTLHESYSQADNNKNVKSDQISKPSNLPSDKNKIPELKNNKPKKIKQSGPTLFDTVTQGGAVMIPILILALLSLTLIIERTIFYFRSGALHRNKIEETLEKVSENSDARFREELQEELDSATSLYVQKLEKGVPLINGIGNIAPILGFFGTVIGMIEAFAAIAAATTVNAKVVAVGIQVALVTTAGGLAVAVPSIFFYHVFMHINQKIYDHADDFIQEKVVSLPRLPLQ